MHESHPASPTELSSAAIATDAPNSNPRCGCGALPSTPGSFVYALGRVAPLFPHLSLEREFIHAAGRPEASVLGDRQVLHDVLSERQHRYLVRQLFWILTTDGVESYMLQPRDPDDFTLLVDALRPAPSPQDIDVVIGVQTDTAPASGSCGLSLPLVVFDQLYSFDKSTFVKSIPHGEAAAESRFEASAGELLDRIMGLAGNSGASDEHRALNYLIVRYPAIYAMTADRLAMNDRLSAVEARRSLLSRSRRLVDVIFSYTGRSSDITEKFRVRVDVTDEFPFLVSKIEPHLC